MADKKLKIRLELLERRLKEQQEQIDKLNKTIKRSKWFIASLLCDK